MKEKQKCYLCNLHMEQTKGQMGKQKIKYDNGICTNEPYLLYLCSLKV